MKRTGPIGDGIRRYENGANVEPPYRKLLHIEEVRNLDRAQEDLEVLSAALRKASHRRDAAVAARAIERLFAADRATRS